MFSKKYFMLLSIIIPIYNIEKYIEKCVSSCLQSSQVSYEIILVNDGTKDGSMDVIRHMSNLPNISIINQENQGLSVARNTGLSKAKGKYIWFVDGDDWIEPNSIQLLAAKLNNDTPDVLAFDVNIHKTNLKMKTVSGVVAGEAYRGFDFMRLTPIYSVWRFWYNRDFLLQNDILFKPGIFHEDGDFNTRVLAHAIKIIYYPILGYHYIADREGSIMNMVSLKRICTGFDFIEIFNQFILDNQFSKKDRALIAIDRWRALDRYFFHLYDRLSANDRSLFKKIMYKKRKSICHCLYLTNKIRYILCIPFMYYFPSIYMYIRIFIKNNLKI